MLIITRLLGFKLVRKFQKKKKYKTIKVIIGENPLLLNIVTIIHKLKIIIQISLNNKASHKFNENYYIFFLIIKYIFILLK